MAPPFNLAAILRLRERKQEQEERTLAQLGMQCSELKAILRRVEDQVAGWTAERTREIGTVCNGVTQQDSYARYKALVEARIQLNEQLRALDKRWQDQKAIYLASRTSREMLEALKQQGRALWKAASDRRESHTLDEIYASRRGWE